MSILPRQPFRGDSARHLTKSQRTLCNNGNLYGRGKDVPASTRVFITFAHRSLSSLL